MNKELRSFGFEMRAEQNEEHGHFVEGRAIVFNSAYDNGYFTEFIDPEALAKTDLKDVRLLLNHNTDGLPLARSRNNTENSTMQLKVVEGEGLDIRADLDVEGNADAKALYSAISRGDISGMSFAFTVRGDSWEDLDSDHPIRRITDIDKVFEISAVTWPAYEATTLEAREAQPEALESAMATLESARAERAAKVEAEERARAEAEEARKAEEERAAQEKRLAEEKARVEKRDRVAGGAGTILKTMKEKKSMFEVNSVEYRDLWCKMLQGKPMTEEERAYAQTGSPIPTLVADTFFAKMKKVAPMLSEITLFEVAGNLKFAAQDTVNTASVHTENQSVSVAADTVVTVTLGANEFMKVITISKSAASMAGDKFVNWLADMLAEDIARAIDNFILNNSTNGVENCQTWTSGTNCIIATTPGYGDILNLIALLPAAYDAQAKFVTNKATLYGKIASIVNSQGNPIFVADASEGFAGKIMGYPVLVDDYVATAKGQLYLGNWKDVVGNLSIPVEVERDDHAAFASGSIMYRGFAAFDSKAAKTDAIVRLTTTA